MAVQIYHDDILYGEYIISDLLEPIPEIPANGSFSTNAANGGNAYGFILPVDNIVLLDAEIGNITQQLGINYGGTSTWDKNHRGIDIGRGGGIVSIEGKEVRAVKAGR